MQKKTKVDRADAEVLAALARVQRQYEAYETLRAVVSPLQLIVEVEEAARQDAGYGQPMTLEFCDNETAD